MPGQGASIVNQQPASMGNDDHVESPRDDDDDDEGSESESEESDSEGAVDAV